MEKFLTALGLHVHVYMCAQVYVIQARYILKTVCVSGVYMLINPSLFHLCGSFPFGKYIMWFAIVFYPLICRMHMCAR